MVRTKFASLFVAAALVGLAGCGDGTKQHCVGSDCLQDGGFPSANAACKTDTDCGGGYCQADGTCSDSYTPSVQANNCNPNPCDPNTQFCSNGACFTKALQCKPADPECIYIPQGSFEPPVRAFWWPWASADGPEDKTGKAYKRLDLELPDFVEVMSTPVVIRLHKDDPAPAIVFNAFSKWAIPKGAQWIETQGVMRAISGVDGSPIWTAPKDFMKNQKFSVNGNSSIAAGDCKGDGEVCLVTGAWDPDDENRCQGGFCSLTGEVCNATDKPCSHDRDHRQGGLIAFGSDGRVLWVNRELQAWWGGPAIARLLGPTGPAQIVVGNGVVDGATGKTLCPQTRDQLAGNGDGTLSILADIDLDGVPEIVTGNNAYKLIEDKNSASGYSCRAIFGDGVKVPSGTCAGGAGRFCGEGFPAVANFAGYGALMGLKKDDPHPQIVVVSHGFLRIHDWTGGMLLSPVPLPADSVNCPTDANQGGAPTIADFDGDGLPEIGMAGQGGYLVWKPGQGFVWRSKTFDCSSNTGSSVFDFEGKGEAKVVYSDQCYMRIYDGKSGATLIEEKNSSCTAYEMPVVADTDGTGRAKIVIPANTFCDYKCDWGRQYDSEISGVKVLASPSDKWVNTRSVWNQHTYHVTNVNLDGTLPWPEPHSWDPGQSNTFRQNVQGKGVFSAPDLAACDVKTDLTDCHKGKATSTVTVYNGGALIAKPGVAVNVYVDAAAGSKLLGTLKTTKALKPGESEQLQITWPAPSVSAPVKLRVHIDEQGLIGDCHPDNNVVISDTLMCPTIG